MPIKISDNLPAAKILESENVFVMTENRAMHQDIRPLKIVILNLMPNKVETETQLLRLLGNSPLQVDIDLMQTATHTSRNTTKEHLLEFYQTFDQLQTRLYDGMIITGAPVENLDFQEVDYWDELCVIMDWSRTHVYSTLHICWGAQAGLFHHHGIPKHPLPTKMSGIFRHRPLDPNHPLLRGFDEYFYMPHSRYTSIEAEDIENKPGLQLLALSETAGVAIVSTRDGPPGFRHGSLRIRPLYPGGGIPSGCPARHPPLSSPILFPRRQPGGSPSDGMAQPREPAVFQLAELLCIPTDAV